MLFVAVGLVPTLIGLGVIPIEPRDLHAPLWVVTLCGLAFILSGALMFLGPGDANASWLSLVLFLAVIAAIASIASWVAFGPGEREFTSGGGAGGIEISGKGDPTFGRIVFGIGAVITWAIFLLALLQGVRKPPSDR